MIPSAINLISPVSRSLHMESTWTPRLLGTTAWQHWLQLAFSPLDFRNSPLPRALECSTRTRTDVGEQRINAVPTLALLCHAPVIRTQSEYLRHDYCSF